MLRLKGTRPFALKYYDAEWNEHIETFDGVNARVIQHEYDHIEGILFIDRMKPLETKNDQSKIGKNQEGRNGIKSSNAFCKNVNRYFDALFPSKICCDFSPIFCFPFINGVFPCDCFSAIFLPVTIISNRLAFVLSAFNLVFAFFFFTHEIAVLESV